MHEDMYVYEMHVDIYMSLFHVLNVSILSDVRVAGGLVQWNILSNLPGNAMAPTTHNSQIDTLSHSQFSQQ